MNIGQLQKLWTIKYRVVFLPRDAMRKRSLCCHLVSVRPSVRPSVTLVHCTQMAEDIVKPLPRPGGDIVLIFRPRAPVPNSKRRKIHVGGKIL